MYKASHWPNCSLCLIFPSVKATLNIRKYDSTWPGQKSLHPHFNYLYGWAVFQDVTCIHKEITGDCTHDTLTLVSHKRSYFNGKNYRIILRTQFLVPPTHSHHGSYYSPPVAGSPAQIHWLWLLVCCCVNMAHIPETFKECYYRIRICHVYSTTATFSVEWTLDIVQR